MTAFTFPRINIHTIATAWLATALAVPFLLALAMASAFVRATLALFVGG